MSTKKGTVHHKNDIKGTPDNWIIRTLADLTRIERSQGRQIDSFAEEQRIIRNEGSVKGSKKA